MSEPKDDIHANDDNSTNSNVEDDDMKEQQEHDGVVRPRQQMQRHGNPWSTASFFSRLVYIWPYPLLELGMKRPLTDIDLPDIDKVDSSHYNRNYLEQLWQAEKKKCKKSGQQPQLWKALLKDFFTSQWHIQPLFVFNTIAKLAQAIALGQLVQSFENTNPSNNGNNSNNNFIINPQIDGYIWASVLTVCGGFILVQIHHQYFITWRKGMQFRIGVIATIYHKALCLSSTHQHFTNDTDINNAGTNNGSRGQIMNLASNDVERFFLACDMLTNLVWSPFQAIAILVVGWWILGPAFASGMILLVIVIVPLQSYLGRKFAYYRSTIANITDHRVTFVSQAIAGVRVMKMSGYENRFLDRIKQLRTNEVTQILKANNLRCWNEAIYFGANVILSTVIFIVHLYINGQLVPGDVFAVITLVNLLQFELTKFVSLGVMVRAQTLFVLLC